MNKLMKLLSIRKRSILVRESSLQNIIVIVQKHDVCRIETYNCGWAKAADVWSVGWTSDIDTFASIMEELNSAGFEILPETVGY